MSMRGNRGSRGNKKEKTVMIIGSVLILSALTITGVSIRNGKENREHDGGYTLDFSKMEEGDRHALDVSEEAQAEDDMDYEPEAEKAGATTIENTYGPKAKVSPSEERREVARAGKEEALTPILSGTDPETEETAPIEGEKKAQETESPEEENEQTISTQIEPELNFTEESRLALPVIGDVVLNFSMDRSIYFPTLQQYKYNPALMIASEAGTPVSAAAAGRVISVYQDAVTGNTVRMDLGNGYELTYGQLSDCTVSEGSYVEKGEQFAKVAEPTRYFKVEGCNLYLKLTKDGVPENPTG